MRDRILAHRGLWTVATEKNTASALKAALSRGFGIETDIRDLDGRLVVSHDPPRFSDALLDVEELFGLYQDLRATGWLALNIKADGLASPLSVLLEKYDIAKAFVFDMSVPDMRGWRGRKAALFTRKSDVETKPAYLNHAQGVWVDDLENGGGQGEWARSIINADKVAALVSPELHNRPHAELWKEWRKLLDPAREERIMLCTDFPDQALEFFGCPT